MNPFSKECGEAAADLDEVHEETIDLRSTKIETVDPDLD